MLYPTGAKIHMHHGRDVVSVLHDLRYSVLGHWLHEGGPPHARWIGLHSLHLLKFDCSSHRCDSWRCHYSLCGRILTSKRHENAHMGVFGWSLFGSSLTIPRLLVGIHVGVLGMLVPRWIHHARAHRDHDLISSPETSSSWKLDGLFQLQSSRVYTRTSSVWSDLEIHWSNILNRDVCSSILSSSCFLSTMVCLLYSSWDGGESRGSWTWQNSQRIWVKSGRIFSRWTSADHKRAAKFCRLGHCEQVCRGFRSSSATSSSSYNGTLMTHLRQELCSERSSFA